jgi:hypothetical protein
MTENVRLAIRFPSRRRARFNGKTWLDQAGHPTIDALHVTERFQRRDFGHVDIQVTITEPMKLLPGTDVLEFVCNENEKDLKHLGKK